MDPQCQTVEECYGPQTASQPQGQGQTVEDIFGSPTQKQGQTVEELFGGAGQVGGEIGQTVAQEWPKEPNNYLIETIKNAAPFGPAVAETIASTATGLASGISSIIPGIAKFISLAGPWAVSKLAGVTPPTEIQTPFQSTQAFMNKWQQVGTYTPKTEQGQYLNRGVNSPLEAVGVGVHAVGTKVFPNSKEGQAAVDVIGNLVLSGLLFKYGGRLIQGESISGAEVKSAIDPNIPDGIKQAIDQIPDEKQFTASPEEIQAIKTEQATKAAPTPETALATAPQTVEQVFGPKEPTAPTPGILPDVKTMNLQQIDAELNTLMLRENPQQEARFQELAQERNIKKGTTPEPTTPAVPIPTETVQKPGEVMTPENLAAISRRNIAIKDIEPKLAIAKEANDTAKITSYQNDINNILNEIDYYKTGKPGNRPTHSEQPIVAQPGTEQFKPIAEQPPVEQPPVEVYPLADVTGNIPLTEKTRRAPKAIPVEQKLARLTPEDMARTPWKAEDVQSVMDKKGISRDILTDMFVDVKSNIKKDEPLEPFIVQRWNDRSRPDYTAGGFVTPEAKNHPTETVPLIENIDQETKSLNPEEILQEQQHQKAIDNYIATLDKPTQKIAENFMADKPISQEKIGEQVNLSQQRIGQKTEAFTERFKKELSTNSELADALKYKRDKNKKIVEDTPTADVDPEKVKRLATQEDMLLFHSGLYPELLLTKQGRIALKRIGENTGVDTGGSMIANALKLPWFSKFNPMVKLINNRLLAEPHETMADAYDYLRDAFSETQGNKGQVLKDKFYKALDWVDQNGKDLTQEQATKDFGLTPHEFEILGGYRKALDHIQKVKLADYLTESGYGLPKGKDAASLGPDQLKEIQGRAVEQFIKDHYIEGYLPHEYPKRYLVMKYVEWGKNGKLKKVEIGNLDHLDEAQAAVKEWESNPIGLKSGEFRNAIAKIVDKKNMKMSNPGALTALLNNFHILDNLPKTTGVQLDAEDLAVLKSQLGTALSKYFAQGHLSKRSNIKGYSTDWNDVVSHYITSVPYSFARRFSAGKINDFIDSTYQGNDYNYAKKLYDYTLKSYSQGEQASFVARRALMYTHLALKGALYALHRSQVLRGLYPYLIDQTATDINPHGSNIEAGKIFGYAILKQERLMKDWAVASLHGEKFALGEVIKRAGYLDPMEKRVMTDLYKEGRFSAMWMKEVVGEQAPSKITNTLNFFGGISDRLNRVDTALSMVRLGEKRGWSYDLISDKVRDAIGNVNFNYGKPTRMQILRNPVVQIAAAFKQYHINYFGGFLPYLYKNNKKAFFTALAIGGGLAGAMGIPFADPAYKGILHIARATGLIKSTEPLDQQYLEVKNKATNNKLLSMLLYGFPAVMGINGARMFGFHADSILSMAAPTDAKAIANTVKSFFDRNSNTLENIRRASPILVKRLIKLVESKVLDKSFALDSNGRPLFTDEDLKTMPKETRGWAKQIVHDLPTDMNTLEWTLYEMGFPTIKSEQIPGTMSAVRNVGVDIKKQKSDINEAMGINEADIYKARKAGDTKALQDAIKKKADLIKEWKAGGFLGHPSSASIRKVKNDMLYDYLRNKKGTTQ